jgi:carbon storage regulator
VLILTRRQNEQIIIGEQIQLTVISIRGGHVRLGVEAPREIMVKREEVARVAPAGTASQPAARQLRLPFPED